MTTQTQEKLETLDDLTTREIKRRWAEVFGEPAPNSHRRYLLKRLAWRIQANAEADITERGRCRALGAERQRVKPLNAGGFLSR